MPQFAVLRHDSPRGVHYDFLLEAGDTLKTWSLPQPPKPGAQVECDALDDHRMAYLDYEGPLSGDRGSVTRWDRGAYLLERQTDNEMVVFLEGEKLAGEAKLCRETSDSTRWRFSLAAT